MKKVICVNPHPCLTVGKVYEVFNIEKTGYFHVNNDQGDSMYCVLLSSYNSHFKEYIEPVKQSVTIEVPAGYKIRSQKVVDNQIVVELEPLQNIVVVSASDTVLTIKPEYLEKLKALGVYERWLSNVKAQYGTTNCRPDNWTNWYELINWSFQYSKTPEGIDFWFEITWK